MAYIEFEEPGAGFGSSMAAARADQCPGRPATLSSLEWIVIALAQKDLLSSLRVPGRIAMALGSVFGVGRNPRLADDRLEALRRITVLSRHYGGDLPSDEVRRFLQTGFSSEQYELVVDSVAAGRRSAKGGRSRVNMWRGSFAATPPDPVAVEALAGGPRRDAKHG